MNGLVLRQACVMSPQLFNIYMDGVVREVDTRVRGRSGINRLSGKCKEGEQLKYVDDTVLI